MPPPTLGRYEIVSELGRGAMGVVYKARDPALERMVAIKTIDMALDRDGMAYYEARLRQEARAAGALHHPNVVAIYDSGRLGEVAYIAMELVEGIELSALLAGGHPLGVPQAIAFAAQAAEGLAHAHSHGIVHRDVKPANLLVTREGTVKITDFGVARMRAAEVHTQAGAMTPGSPRYMSPEQVLDRRADQRSDVFSLGVVLYEMLAGRAPFSGESLSALVSQIVNRTPPAPSALNSQVPERLDRIVARMLAKAPEARYASAAEVARELRGESAEATPAPLPPGAPAAPAGRSRRSDD
jgi:serine/threonine-protein kinase